MELKTAKRDAVKMRVGLSGASGFGKTYSKVVKTTPSVLPNMPIK